MTYHRASLPRGNCGNIQRTAMLVVMSLRVRLDACLPALEFSEDAVLLRLEATLQLVAYQSEKRIGFSRVGLRLGRDRETDSREIEER